MKKISTYLSLLFILSTFLVTPLTVIADGVNNNENVTTQKQIEGTNISQYSDEEKSVQSSTRSEQGTSEAASTDDSSTLKDTQTDEKQQSKTTQSSTRSEQGTSESTSTDDSSTLKDTQTDEKQQSETTQSSVNQIRGPSISTYSKVFGSEFITDANLYDSKGNVVKTSSGNSNLTATWDFKIPGGSNIQSGDTMVIDIPDILRLQKSVSFDILDIDGNIIGHAVADQKTKKITITFTNYAEEHNKNNIIGKFSIYTLWNADSIHFGQNNTVDWGFKQTIVYINPLGQDNRILTKAGTLDPNDDTKIKWTITLNKGKQEIKNAFLEDTFGKSQNLIPETLVLVYFNADGTVQKRENISNSSKTITYDNKGLKIDFGDINQQIYLYYSTRATDGGASNSYTNSVKFTGDNIEDQILDAATPETGGTGMGYTLTDLTVKKIWDDNNNQDKVRPKNAEVQLYKNGAKEGNSVFLDSSNSWTTAFHNLDTHAKYTAKEINIPDGYTANYDITIDSSGVGIITITNSHTPETTTVKGTKTWNDKDNQDGKRPDAITVNLLADGQPVDSKEVTSTDGWTYEFTNLPKYQNGQLIKYTVEEAAVAGYETTYDGNNIVNTHQVAKTSVSGQKTWLDNNDQDGNRPDSITLHLLANGKEVATKAVTAKDDWKYEFNDLDEYSAGKKIVYTITEDQVNDYNSDVSDAKNIVNKYTPGKTSATVTKVWQDADNQDGLRTSIKVQLYANDKAYGDPVELTSDTGWTYTWNDLNQRQNHKDVKYTVKEVNTPDGYVAEVNSEDQGNLIITNTHKVAKTSVSGQKTWSDHDNQDGVRPDEITVNLLADGKKVDSKTVTAKDGWKYEFNDLDKFKAGQEIKYTVEEAAVAGYETTYDGNNIVNTHQVAKTSVSGQKTWSDHDNQDGVRPDEITVNLLADGKKVDSKTVTAKDGWKYEFNDLDKFKAGQEIKYTVEEAAVAGYETTYDGNNIVNTHQVAKTSVSGQKTWLDNNDQDGNRPDSITLHLLANGKEVATKAVTAKDDWKYEFNDLDEYSAGKKIVYTITEDQVNDYNSDVSDAKNIVNKYTPGKTSATVTKAWQDADNQDGLRTSIKVQLYANDKAYGDPVELTSDTGWTYTWNDLNQRQNHKDVKYTVKEVNTPDGYVAEVNSEDQGNLIITNTHKVAKTSVSGQKTWSDHDNQDGVRPDEITVNLLADGKKVDSKTVTAKDGWKYEFNDLDKFKAGQEIKYTVEEAAVAGYETTYDGNNIVNTHQVAKTSVSGQKTWSDHDNQDGVRPDEITVNLLADGKKVDSKTVTAKDGWKYEFNDLDKFKAGQEIKYTVEEAAVAGYETTYDGNNIVNTHQVAKTSVSGQKTWSDHDNQDGVRPDEITVNLLADGKKVDSKTVTAKDGWKYEFNDLDKFKAGQEIKYSISEDKVTGYKTTVSGYDLTNILNESSIPVKNQSINQGTPKNHKHQGSLESILPATGVSSSKNFVISGLVFILFALSSLGYVFIKRRHND